MSFGYRAKFNTENAVKDPLTADRPDEDDRGDAPDVPPEAPTEAHEDRPSSDVLSPSEEGPRKIPGGDQ